MGGKLLVGAKTRVRSTLGLQGLQGLCVMLRTLRLAVGSVLSTDIRPLLPVHSEPRQLSQRSLEPALLAAARVGVFRTNHELTAGPAGRQEIEQRRAHVAQVQAACGAGRETGSDGRP